MKHNWSEGRINNRKKFVKQELDFVTKVNGSKARLLHSIKKITELENKLDEESVLDWFLYMMSAMVHHEKFGGLTDLQVNRLFDNCFSVLNIARIDIHKSRLRFMFEELYLVQSQIERKAGRSWNSAWIQRLALRNNSESLRPHKLLGMGIRDLRLGNTSDALELFKSSYHSTQNETILVRAKIGEVTTLRLQCRFKECKSVIENVFADHSLNEREKLEFSWAEICLRFTGTQDPNEMIKAVSPRGSHRQACYFLEAYLWLMTLRKYNTTDRLSKVSSQVRKGSLEVNKEGYLYKVALLFEKIYDADYTFENRLQMLGQSLGMRDQLLFVEHELLFLAAAINFLNRNRTKDLMRLVFNDYRKLCLHLTNGEYDDCLGIFDDIKENITVRMSA